MKLRKIFSAEFAYQLGRISTRLYLAVLFIFPLMMSGLVTPGDGIYPNNTFHITAITVIGSFIWLVMSGSIAGEAAARDVQMRIHPLIFSSPVSKLNYLGGRFLAALAVNALLIFFLVSGVLLSFYLPGMAQEELLAFRPLVYLNVYFLIALPAVFVATALQFSFAALSRMVMTSYLAALLLALFPLMIAMAAAKFFGNWDLAILLDPVGLAGIIGGELQTWTVPEKNTRLISPEGMFLLNRVLWLSIATGILWFTYLGFSFTTSERSSRWNRFKRRQKKKAEATAETGIIRASAISVPKAKGSFEITSYCWQALSIAGASFKKITTHPLGLSLVGGIVLISVIFAESILSQQGIPIHPTTGQVIIYLTAPVSSVNTPWIVIPLLIMFLVGELVWRERDAGLSEIADAAPIPDCVLFLGKFLGMGLLILVWMALLTAGGILMQLSLGAEKLDLVLYLQTLFGLQLIDYLLFALLVFVVHVVVNQKYTGFLVVLLIFSFMAFPSKFGVEHNMLIYGADPGWEYSDMRGFGHGLKPWLWFKLYWTAWALLLAIAAKLLWSRGKEQGLKYRLQLAKRRLTGPTINVAAIGAGLLIAVGSFIFYNTNVLNEYLNTSDLLEQKAEYERRYGRYKNSPQPQITATKLQVELYPHRQQAEIRATYTLVNKASVAIDSIHIGSASGVGLSKVNFDRSAKAVVIDKEFGHQIHFLKQPLKPGDSLQLNFMVQHEQRGFQQRGTKPLVVKNGTYFTNDDLLPEIGYQRSREINDAGLRKKYKLAARPEMPSLYDPEARKRPVSIDQTTLEVIIGTAKDEIGVAPGAFQSSWTTSNRRYFHYKTDGPIGGEYRILSADYAVKESEWKDVAIKIYYHPGHGQNIDRMLQSAKASLEYYTAQFGPYPFRHLTLVESAGNTGGASADADIIYFGEQYAVMDPDDGPEGFDLPYYIMAHEVAHQWWGIARLAPAYVEGAGTLIEGLSVYSGMQVLEKAYGKSHLQQYVNFLHSSYEIPRSLASPSLLQANEPFLYYKKGGLAMYALSKYTGKEKVNAALRNLLQKHESGELPLPTSLDLYRELQEVTPDSLNYLLHDLFKENTYWRLETKQISAQETTAGIWEVTLNLKAEKFTVDHAGNEKEVPMNDWLEIGIFEENRPLYLKIHRIKSGEQTIKVSVPQKPTSGGIDPHYLMIDLRIDDNVKEMEIIGG